jgi:uncharacterized protein (TIGR01319 family)
VEQDTSLIKKSSAPKGKRLLSIDIGSTYTKGAVFRLSGESLEFLNRAVCPTTVAHLKNGFDAVRYRLDPNKTADRVYFSSSAKGGLAISAIGLVPDLTLKAARSAALSAGGKVVSVHAYKLTITHLEELTAQKPDILLLAGGTDGGNESYVRHNAEILCRLPSLTPDLPLPAVVYAGNSVLKDEICAMLGGACFDVYPAQNILPQIDQMTPDGAREKIRDVFLRSIVHGKGLDAIQAEIGAAPLPTPLAVLKLVEAMRAEAPWDFLLIDMGGATTDVYSAGGGVEAESRVIMRGLPEPEIKRTVEGDLGMRVSAAAAANSADDALSRLLKDDEREAFATFIARLTAAPDYLPAAPVEIRFDGILASICIQNAMQRHAGTWRRVFTAMGETFVQQGKDLRGIPVVIGSGGFLSAMEGFVPGPPQNNPHREIISLTPERYNYHRDYNYLFPLLGSIAAEFPRQAALCAMANISGIWV